MNDEALRAFFDSGDWEFRCGNLDVFDVVGADAVAEEELALLSSEDDEEEEE